MRILIIHNRYKVRSGEDNVFRNEVRMLREFGNQVEEVIFDNKSLTSVMSKLKAGILSIYNPVSSKKIRNKISEFNPDVIHIHNFFPLISPSVFFRRTRKSVPIVMTLHNFRLICPNALLFRNGRPCEKCVNRIFPIIGVLYKCYRNSYIQTLNIVLITSIHKLLGTWKRRVNKYIVLSEFQKGKIINSSLGLKEDKIVVKPNFVFDINSGSIPKKKDYFVYIGRLEKDKGVETLLSSFRNMDYNLRIIGEGTMRREVEKVCIERKNIKYLGAKDREFVISQLKPAKGLIFPSFYYEGFPLVIAEAFSCGTPVISSDIGSHSEIVTDGFNGLHFSVGDPVDLTIKVRTIAEMKDGSMNKNAIDTSADLYNEKNNYKLLIKIYEDLIGKEKTF